MNHSFKEYLDNKGQKVYEIRVWDQGRKASQIRRRFSSAKERREFLDEVRMKPELEAKEKNRLEHSRTFGDEYTYWSSNKAIGFSPGWKNTVESYWRELEDDLFTLEISKLDKAFLSDLTTKLLRKGNSRKTINNKIGFIQSVLAFSEENNRVNVNLIVSFKKTKPPQPTIEFWEADDSGDFLSFANGKYPVTSQHRWIYSAYFAALNTGVRAGELWAMRPSCLKRTANQIYVREQFNRVSRKFTLPKGRGPRNVPMSDQLLKELDQLIEAKRLGRNDLLFGSGAPVDHDNFTERVWKRDLEEWGGKSIKFHGLRHTSATSMLTQGIDVKTVQEILGHKEITTTMRYVHALGNSVQSAAKSFSIQPNSENQKLRLVR